MDTPFVNYNRLLDATAGGAGPTWHAKLGLDSGATMAARVGGNGSWQLPSGLHFNAPTLLNDPDSRSVFFSRGQSYGTTTSPISSASFTADMALQIGSVTEKQVLLTHDDNVATPGRFSVEIVADGAGGMRPRVFSRDAGGTPVVLVGTALGTVPIGVPCKLTYVRDGAHGSQRVYINGSEIALALTSGTIPASWSGVPSGTWAIGMWPVGPVLGIEGLIAELALWDVVLGAADIQSLAVPAALPAIHMSDLDVGDVVANQTKTINLDHITAPLGQNPSIVSQGGKGTASPSGTDINYQAGATLGADSFEARVTKDSRDSRVALFSINIISAGSGGDATNWKDSRDAFWNGLEYSTFWQRTPVAGDIGTGFMTYMTGPWANGQTTHHNHLDTSRGTMALANAPDGAPAIRAVIFGPTTNGDSLTLVRGTQLSQSSNFNHGVYSMEIWFAAIAHRGSLQGDDARSGLYCGHGHHWGSTPGVTSIPGGSSNPGSAWSARVPLSGVKPHRYTNYLYRNGNTGSGHSGSTNVQPVLGQWNLVEQEITTTHVRIYVNGSLIRTDTLDMRGSPTPNTNIKHRGMGFFVKHNGGAPIQETIFWRRFKVRGRV